MKFHLAVKKAMAGAKITRPEELKKSHIVWSETNATLERVYANGTIKAPRFYSKDVLADDWKVVNG